MVINEIWLDIAGYEGAYQVSDLGSVRSKNRILKGSPGSNGYLTVGLHKGTSQKTFPIHFLVAQAFLGSRPSGLQINHINAVKSDNRLVNLEYCTPSKNRAHSFAIGNESTAGEQSKVAKLCNRDILEIRYLSKAGHMQKDIAKTFGITQSNVSLICSNKRWGHMAGGY